ncbi:hypothetical protein LCGC14_0701510 [marine sediment metagenome]|uniref:Metallo-beta-lactamase domain-containing protein n=1 Tax=marine sediment metagenome TaxID=412755 RepID=A0A0F9TQD8_9ZZZZ
MQIQTFHSSSAGNLYRVDDLLIDPGVPIKQIKRCLDHRLCDITAALISHEHQDHCRGVRDLMKCGVDCYMTQGTAKALKVSGHRVHVIEADKQFQVGNWLIKPFETFHNAAEPVGFLLATGMEKLAFVTDTLCIRPVFTGLTHLMVEIDFDMDILRANVRQGSDMAIAKNVIRNHLSLDTAKAFFRANDMSAVQEIHLLHLSTGNADAALFKKEIQEITGRPVYIGG